MVGGVVVWLGVAVAQAPVGKTAGEIAPGQVLAYGRLLGVLCVFQKKVAVVDDVVGGGGDYTRPP